MSSIVKRTFSINLKIMRMFGFYPFPRHRTLYKLYAYLLYCLFTVPLPTLSSLYILLNDNITLTLISENAFVICETGCFIFKLFPFIYNANQIKDSVYMMEIPIFNCYNNKQKKMMDQCIKICRRNSYSFLIFCIMTVISWASVPFLGDEYKLPVDVWLPYDPTTGAKVYFLTFFGVLSGITSVALSNGMIDPMVAGLAYYATTQIKILKDNLQHLSEYADEEILSLGSSGCDKEFLKAMIIYKKVQFCIQHHSAILKFVQTYEDTYSWIVFSQFAASVVVICISLLQLSMVQPFTYNFFAMIIFIFTLLMEIYLYCYYGSTLFEESNTLPNAVYMSQWYEYDIKSKKSLIIFMQKAQKPMVVTAGKILELSLVTFMTILKRSYSLLAVLKN